MTPRTWFSIGCVQAGVAVMLGAFAAHALNDRLVAADQLANWHTAVRYQMWHALALMVFAGWRERHAGTFVPAWAFLIGSILFSGSVYLLALDLGKSMVWPLTPIGGGIILVGWFTAAVSAWRGRGAS